MSMGLLRQSRSREEKESPVLVDRIFKRKAETLVLLGSNATGLVGGKVLADSSVFVAEGSQQLCAFACVNEKAGFGI